MEWWLEHRGCESRDGIGDALCLIIFNGMGYLHEILKEREYGKSKKKSESSH